ncbi:MAG: polysaccharide deacetylase family protein [Planctomycetota bacterium]
MLPAVWIGAGAGAVAASAAYLAPALVKPFAIRALLARAQAQRALVLTYDDGPGPTTTARLLDVLAEFEARATFFVSGSRAAQHGAAVERLVTAGHEVGSHGFDHLHAWRAAPWRVARDVARGAAEVRRLTGRPAAPFRPPYGKATLASTFAAARARAPLAWWTHDSGDSFATLPASLPNRDELLATGGVLLLHDLDRSAPRNEYVLSVTRDLLAAARSRALQVQTLGELLGR